MYQWRSPSYINLRFVGLKSNNFFVKLIVLSETGLLVFQDHVKSKIFFLSQPQSLESLTNLSARLS